MKFENIALVVPLVIAASILFFLSDINVFESGDSQKIVAGAGQNNASPEEQKIDATEDEKALQNAFDEYDAIYEEEYTAFKNEIEDSWGEYKESSATQWVSYVEGNQIRRTVDYDSGRIVVEMLLEKTEPFSTEKKKTLENKVRDLLGATESSAFENDELAQKVEARLPEKSDLIVRGKLTNKRLFSFNKISSVNFNYTGIIKVSTRFRNTAMVDVQPAKIRGFNVIRSHFSVAPSVLQNAVRYEEAVIASSQKQKITTALIYAIMESESSFNPVAKSRVPAYGLMQIVPRSAGKDATKHLYGKAKILSPSYLYNTDNNIEVGAAYLHVIFYRYLRKIKDHRSRVYLAIAAYNTGSANVARAFIKTKNFSRAVDKINGMTSDEVYIALTKKLRFREARRYVKKVAGNMKKYW